MAGEVLQSGLGDLAKPAAKGFTVLAKDRSSIGAHPALHYAGSISGMKTNVIPWCFIGVNGYDPLTDAGELDTDAPNETLTDDSADITVTARTVLYNVSELAMITGAEHEIFTAADALALNAVVSRDVKLTNLICAIGATGSNIVGSTAVPMSVDLFLTAKGELEKNAGSTQGRALCVMAPQAWLEFSKDMVGQAALWVSAEGVFADEPRTGHKGSFGGVDIFVTSAVATTDTGAAHGNLMFTYGAIGWGDADFSVDDKDIVVNLGKVAVKKQGDISANMTEVLFSCYLGVSLGDENCLVVMKSAAA